MHVELVRRGRGTEVARSGRLITNLRAATVAAWLVAITLVGLPLAVGGVHVVTVSVAATLLTAALGLLVRDASSRGARIRLDLFAFVPLALLALTLLQTVPLPSFLLRLVAPQNHDIYQSAVDFLGPAAAGRTAFPVALDVPGALEAAIFIWTCAAAFVACSTLASRSEDTADWLLRALVTAGALVLGLGVIQTTFGLEGVLDVYPVADSGATAFFRSTFVNPNHLAGFLTFSGLIALGQSQNADQPRETIVFGALFLACIVAAVLTLSRGGMVAALAGSVVYGGVSIRNQRPGLRTAVARLWLLGVLAVVTTVAMIGYDAVLTALGTVPGFADAGRDVKVAAFAGMRSIVSAFPTAGVGPGATADVFALVNDVSPGVSFSHAESFPLQLAINWGVPAAAAALLLGGVATLPALVRCSSQALLLGVGVGLYTLLAHNLVDFSLSVAGVAVPAAAALGVLMGLDRRDARRDGRARPRPGVPAPLAYALTGLALVGVVLATGWILAHDRSATDAQLRERYERAAAALDAGQPVSADLDAAVVEAVLRTPADHHVYFQEGMVQLRLGRTAEATRWFERALSRAPLAFGPLRMLARTKARSGDEAGALTLYQRIFEAYRERWDQVVQDLLSLRDPAAALDLVTETSEELAVRLALRLSSTGRRDLGIDMLRHRLRREPELYDARRQLGLLLVESGALAAAEAEATQLIARHDLLPGGFLLQGILAERAGELLVARHMFQEAHRLDPSRPDALLGLARSLVALEDWDRLREVIGRLRPLVAQRPNDLAQLHVILSHMAEQQGDVQMALHEMTMASRLSPRNVGYLVRLGDRYAAALETGRARSAWQQALRMDPGNAAAKQRLDAKQ